MGKTRRYELDGLTLDIPLIIHERTGKCFEDYTAIIKTQVWTTQGCPVKFSADDPCEYAGEDIHDCGLCRFYTPAGEHSLIGVCRNENKRKGAGMESRK